MKITQVKPFIMWGGDAGGEAFSSTLWSQGAGRNWLFVKVETDEGIHGWGEGSLVVQTSTIAEAVRTIPFNIKGIEELHLPAQTLKKLVAQGRGLVLFSGVTGAGKTTTMNAVIDYINKNFTYNIITIEDPIEYRMTGLNQSQVNPKIGYTFAGALRSFLRQDPDIIMVGEIRDKETAQIAIHAALTGHLVLSTLHTNDAPTTLPRLSEMGIPAFLVASTANVIVAQRLVRKICQDCIESFNLSKTELLKLEKQVNLPSILETLKNEGITSGKQIKERLLFYRGKGCKN